MPIRPELRKLYPANWKDIRQRICFDRAQGRCERCGVRNYGVGRWVGQGNDARFEYVRGNRFWDQFEYADSYQQAREACDELNMLNPEQKNIVIVLTTAHLDHDPTNNDEHNLAALCQRCHLRHDTKQHAASRRLNREKARKQQRLFER